MKQKLSIIVMVNLLFVISFTACGTSKENSTITEDMGQTKGQEVLREADNESDTTTDNSVEVTTIIGQSVVGKGIQVEGPDDDTSVIVEVEGAVTEITDGEVTEITDGEVVEVVEGEVVEIVEGEVTESTATKGDDASGVILDDTTDWSAAYADYFDRENIMPAKHQITIITAHNDLAIEMVMAVTGEDSFLSYDFATSALELYAVDGKVYAWTRVGAEEAWIWAPVESEEDAEVVTGITDLNLVDREDMAGWTYREAITENGVIYDVLEVEVADSNGAGTAVYFVNRATQYIEKCVMEPEGAVQAVCLVKEIEKVELPAEAAKAAEVPMEDVLGAIVEVMMVGSGME